MTGAIYAEDLIPEVKPSAVITNGTRFENNRATRESTWVKYTVLTIGLAFLHSGYPWAC